jgi:hypothetical protein
MTGRRRRQQELLRRRKPQPVALTCLTMRSCRG